MCILHRCNVICGRTYEHRTTFHTLGMRQDKLQGPAYSGHQRAALPILRERAEADNLRTGNNSCRDRRNRSIILLRAQTQNPALSPPLAGTLDVTTAFRIEGSGVAWPGESLDWCMVAFCSSLLHTSFQCKRSRLNAWRFQGTACGHDPTLLGYTPLPGGLLSTTAEPPWNFGSATFVLSEQLRNRQTFSSAFITPSAMPRKPPPAELQAFVRLMKTQEFFQGKRWQPQLFDHSMWLTLESP